MGASLLDGKYVAAKICADIANNISTRTQQGKILPGLAVIFIGNDPASAIYVANKRKTCIKLGFYLKAYDLPVNTSTKELLTLIHKLNADISIHGILLQLPLATHIDANLIIANIDPKKDVDGFHPYNFGCLAQGKPFMRPCTPYGIIQLLHYYEIELYGKHAVVVGASNLVGRPMALELLLGKATVTICHSATKDLELHIKNADIIIAATGHYDIIKTNWLYNHHILIDVGIHRSEDGAIFGDIDFHKAQEKVQWITPVPGGVGPMTICTLLQNTLLAADSITQ